MLSPAASTKTYKTSGSDVFTPKKGRIRRIMNFDDIVSSRLAAKPPSLLEEETAETISSSSSSSSQLLSTTTVNVNATAATGEGDEEGRGIREVGEEDEEDIITTNAALTVEEDDDNPLLLTRRQWFQQCALVGGGLAASAFISQQNDLKRKEEERKAFIRLEPFPHRKRKDKQEPSKPAPPKNIGISNATSTFNTTSTSTTPNTNNSTTAKNATSATTKTTSAGSTNKTSATTTPTSKSNATTTTTTTTKPKPNNVTSTANKELAPVNFTKVATENSINITLKSCDGGCVKINGTTLQKVQTPTKQNYPWFVPKFLQPAPKVLKDIPDNEVLVAATVAGSAIEMVRTTLLYPLATVKTRIQTRQQEQRKVKLQRTNRQKERLMMTPYQGNDSSSILKISSSSSAPKNTSTSKMQEEENDEGETTNGNANATIAPAKASNATTTNGISSSSTSQNSSSSLSGKTTVKTSGSSGSGRNSSTQKNIRQLRRRLRVLRLNVKRHVAEGNLYAGLVPTLLVSVPATGVYYGVRDVTKRMLVMSASGTLPGGLVLNDAAITLLGAFVADVVSLAARTPADALAARLQAVAAAEKSSRKRSSSSKSKTARAAVADETSGSNTTTIAQREPHNATNGSHLINATSESVTLLTDQPSPSQPSPPPKSWSSGMGDADDDAVFTTDDDDDDETTITMSAIDLALEALLREEEEHYRQRETNLIIDKTNSNGTETTFWASEGLSSSSSSPYNDERYLLMQLPCYYEINVQDLYNGVGIEGDTTTTATTTRRVLTTKQLKRHKRKQRKMQRKRLKQIAKCETRNAWLINTPPQHLYTQEFLEGLQAETNSSAAWSESILNNVTMNAGVTEWDKPRWNLVDIVKEQLALLAQQKNNTTQSLREGGEEELPSIGANNTKLVDNATATTSQQQQTDDDDSIRMPEKEERELLKELQEESIYQEDWFRQSLERLPAIIITDLPYLLSRIALNRIIIHGTVNIGQYEVATIGIAIVCALITTPFDVVRTRLLVENNDEDIIAPCDDPTTVLANTSSTTAVADGNIILINNNVTTPAASAALQDESPNPDYLSEGVLRTMICISKEGDGGVRNLYAGWLERTLYFGIGRAWLDPINIITYIGIRDTLLLKLFD